MELRQYLALFRKWAWLILLATAVGAILGYYHSRTIPPTYRSSTTLLVGRVLDNPNPSANQVQTASNVAEAYAQLATQPPILQATADAIHWPESWQTLFFRVSATTAGSQLLRIDVTDSSPERAKTIADALAQQLITQGPISAQQKQAEAQSAFLTTQLAQLTQQIDTNQKTLNNLTHQAALENDPLKLADLNTRITALQTKVDTWQQNYANLSTLLENASSLFLTILVPAQVPTTPISPNIPQNIVFGAIAGLVLAVGGAFLIEYFNDTLDDTLDDTVKNAGDVQRVLDLSTLGSITRIADIHQPADHLVTAKHPRSPTAEAYRILRTNLHSKGLENPSGALLITSAGPSEGKTTTAANLAVVMAQAGKRVILMDADLRRPSLHQFFGLPNEVGLSTLMLEDVSLLDRVIQSTAIEGLRVITSGPLPPNPAEVLDSKPMDDIMNTLRKQVDMLILDSPPILAVADASILGSRCSGAVLVIDAGRTHNQVCRRGLETLAQTGVQVYGVVLNKLALRRASGYYYYYYSKDGKSKEKRRKTSEE